MSNSILTTRCHQNFCTGALDLGSSHWNIENGQIYHKPKAALRRIKMQFGNDSALRFHSCILTGNNKSSLHSGLPNTLRQLLSTKHKETHQEALLAAAAHFKNVSNTDNQTSSELNSTPKSSPGSNLECFSNIPRAKFSSSAVSFNRSAASQLPCDCQYGCLLKLKKCTNWTLLISSRGQHIECSFQIPHIK